LKRYIDYQALVTGKFRNTTYAIPERSSPTLESAATRIQLDEGAVEQKRMLAENSWLLSCSS
jgi:hypothetical protein